jgi:ribosomal protein L7/L12
MARTPPERPAGSTPSIRDALAEAARRKPAPSRRRWVLWAVFGGAALVAGIAQVAGWTKSPVAERVLEERRRRGELPGQPAGDAPAPARRDVVLTAVGDRPAEVLAALRQATGLALSEAKALVEAVPATLAKGVPAEEAARLERLLRAAGATVEVR